MQSWQKKLIIGTGLLAIATLVVAFSDSVLAADVQQNLTGGSLWQEVNKEGFGQNTYGPNTNIIVLIGRFINVLLGFLGMYMVLLFLYAGFLYFTAHGESKPTEKALEIVKQAVIGTLIIFSAWGLSWFVTNTLLDITTGTVRQSSFIPVAYAADVRSAVQTPEYQNSVGQYAQNNYLISLISNIINTLLGFLGVAMVLLFLYAGYLYLTAGGDPKPTEKAKEMIKQGVIGIGLILAAWGLSYFVINTLFRLVLGPGTGAF